MYCALTLPAYLMKLKKAGLFLLIALSAWGCKFYKRDLILKLNKENPEVTPAEISAAIEIYKIRPGDQVELKVYTNKGELLIDPNSELSRALGSGAGSGAGNVASGASAGGSGSGTTSTSQFGRYQVGADGTIILPMVGRVKLDGYTQRQADSVLSGKFGAFYEDPYTVLRVANRRVIVFGASSAGGAGAASGANGKVIPLLNDNMTLLEIIADAGGIGAFSDMKHIRLIRGDLSNPSVYLIDLTTIAGMKSSIMKMQPNDIIYIEPSRKVPVEVLRDITPSLTLVTTLSTLLVLILTRF